MTFALTPRDFRRMADVLADVGGAFFQQNGAFGNSESAGLIGKNARFRCVEPVSSPVTAMTGKQNSPSHSLAVKVDIPVGDP